MRILIAVDGSSASDAVIQETVVRPWPKGTEMCLVTTVDPYFFTRAPLLLEEMKLKTGEGLEESARPLREAGWVVARTRWSAIRGTGFRKLPASGRRI